MRLFVHVPVALAFLAGLAIGGLKPGWPGQPASARPVEAATAERRVQPRTAPIGAYRADVLKVIDGDTVEARIHVWLGQEIVTRVRLDGIDAPEMAGRCAFEREAARRARDRLVDFVAAGEAVLTDARPDKYFGRVGGRLSVRGQDAGAMLLAEGLARPSGARRAGWC